MSALEDKIAALSAKFAARAPAERVAIAEALDSGDRATLVASAHKLAGIAGMFGHSDIGAAAFALEEAALRDGDLITPAATLLALLDRL